VEHHGEIHNKKVFAIIPARYASTRLPGKMLREIGGKPLIMHAFERASEARSVSEAIVATDDARIFDAVHAAGGKVVMTRADHASGSDRIAQVALELPEGSIIVNVQGDEPLISRATIDAAVEAIVNDESAQMSTTCEPIDSVHELLNANVVKVVVDDKGYARHFSRSPMPFPRDAALRYGGSLEEALIAEPEILSIFRKHTGLYVYRREYLLRLTGLPQTRLEMTESLEQLRALEDGARIRVLEAVGRSIGVDTESDLLRVRELIEGR